MQTQLLYILDDLLSTFLPHKTFTCSNCSETMTLSIHPQDKYKINDRNKIKKFGFSITQGIHCRYEPNHIHHNTSDTTKYMDYYLSDDYDENGIMFCSECVCGLYPCFICLKLDHGGPGTDPSDCDYCVNKVIHHICRRDHLNVNIKQVQTERANRDHYVDTFNPRLFVCKYCLKLKIGQEFSHYINDEYNKDGKNNDDTVGAYDDDRENVYIHYSSNEEYCSSTDEHHWQPPIARRSMCNACAHRYFMGHKMILTNAYIYQYLNHRTCFVPQEIRMMITLYYYPPNKQHQFDDYLTQKAEEEIAAHLRRQQREKEEIWRQKKAKHVDTKLDEEVIVCKTVFSDPFLMILINDEDLPLKEEFGDQDVEWMKYKEAEKVYFKYNLKFWLSKYFVIQVYNGLCRLIQRNKIHKWKQVVLYKKNQHEFYRDIAAKALFDLIVRLAKLDIAANDSFDVNAIYDDVLRIKKHSKHQSKLFQNALYQIGENNEIHEQQQKRANGPMPHSRQDITTHDTSTYDGDDESEEDSSSNVAPNIFADTVQDSD